MSVSFGEKNAAEFYFGDTAAAEIYFGDALVWSGKRLLMGNTKYVCIEFIPETDIIASSQNPVTISVFMNTDSYTTTDPPMWVLDDAGVTVGFSNVGTVGSEEVIKKQSGYKRTNTFTDNMLFLTAGKTYYICYKIGQWDDQNHYFAYYNKGTGNYKEYNVCFASSAVVNMSAYNDIGTLSAFADAIDASNNDLFIWNGVNACGLTPASEYVRNNTSLSNYTPELNFGSTDKFEVLNHILFMDKGDGQYGQAGDRFVITETYTSGPIGVIERQNNYTNHVWIPPIASHFNRNADAYKYIFDPAVHLSDNDSQGKALVWGNNYIYEYGKCYTRGGQYLGYSCFESRTSSYIDALENIANVSSNELFYVDDNVKDALNTSKGLKVMGTQTFDTAIASPGSAVSDAPKVFAAIANTFRSASTVLLVGQAGWPFGNKHIYSKAGTWNNQITSNTPLTTEPASPATNDVYYKAANVTWGSISNECIVKYNGTGWDEIYTYTYSNYFTDVDVAQSLFSDATTNGILNSFNDTGLYQTVNISNLFTSIQGSTDFANTTVSSDKKHYLEINGVEV